MQDIERQIQVINNIIHATDEEIHNLKFLLDRINEFGITPLAWLQELDDKPIYTENGMIQVPGELASFCLFLSEQEIHTALEVGVYRGRSSYFICAVLYRMCPNLVYHMVDIADYLDGFEEFQQVLPCLKKHIPNTTADFIAQQYDFVFIDADHSYEGSMADYLNVGQYAKKMVCFHDIYAHEYDSQKGGTVRTWEEVCTMTPGLPKMVFSQFPNRWMGIGVVINLSNGDAPITAPETYHTVVANRDDFMRNIEKKTGLYVYGARNDSRRMYRALKQMHCPVIGLLISEESENPEKVEDIPVFNINEIVVGDTEEIVICYRPSIRQDALDKLEKYKEQLIVCDDLIASFIKG